MNLSDLFFYTCKKFKNNVAIESNKNQLRFMELYQYTYKIKNEITEDDKAIGIFINPSSELMIGIWAILLKGGCYVPIATDYPQERIKYIVQHSGIKTIITDNESYPNLSEVTNQLDTHINILNINNMVELQEQATSEHSFQYDLPPIVDDAPAYVIYTSGSTGLPKGVEISHASLVNQLAWLRDYLSIGVGTKILQKTPISFDAAQWEVLSLALGCTVVAGSHGIHRDVDLLLNMVSKHHVTHLQCVPTLLSALIRKSTMQYCDSLCHMLVGGEALTKDLATQFVNDFPGLRLTNLYGPTECTINASSFEVNAQSLSSFDGDIVPIGRPVSGVNFYIQNELSGQLQNMGTGELCIEGRQLAKQYLNDPEKTANAFVQLIRETDQVSCLVYKTGDRVRINQNGDFEFIGRLDNQIKINGFRVELTEITAQIENHAWVKNAVTVLTRDPRTGSKKIVSGITLDQANARLMDQHHLSDHHQTKSNKRQVKAQLAKLGQRTHFPQGASSINLPYKQPLEWMENIAFARKTFRFFDGDQLQGKDVESLLHSLDTSLPKQIQPLTLDRLAKILRCMGAFYSDERLLPKFGYASPGALYSLQFYLSVQSVEDLENGLYYYDPYEHKLVQINSSYQGNLAGCQLHIVGIRSAISSVYTENVDEVIEIECGHAIGLLEKIVRQEGISLGLSEPVSLSTLEISDVDDTHYLTSLSINSHQLPFKGYADYRILFQIHTPQSFCDLGIYEWTKKGIQKISDEMAKKTDVIAINQGVYERSSFGVHIITSSPDSVRRYIELGRILQHLQMNSFNIGLMSSGYSSKTGYPLPTSVKISNILSLDQTETASYFALAGKISDEQIKHRGMREDSVHTKGPTEILSDKLAEMLPTYMIPSSIFMFDELPCLPNGKVDSKKTEQLITERISLSSKIINPRNQTEEAMVEIWRQVLDFEEVSVDDDFFRIGGNSLQAVDIIHRINELFNTHLSLQIIFDCPTIESLAQLVSADSKSNFSCQSRMILFHHNSACKEAVFCWPGLGGYPFNLKAVVPYIADIGDIWAIQAAGINQGELPISTIDKIALSDLELIDSLPEYERYHLLGYSFGAKVVLKVAEKLEQMSRSVGKVILLAPGAPSADKALQERGEQITWENKHYLSLLFSVFFRTTQGPLHDQCLKTVKSKVEFIQFIDDHLPHVQKSLIEGIIAVVEASYDPGFNLDRDISAGIQSDLFIIKAEGDDYHSLDQWITHHQLKPTIIESLFEHFDLLKPGNLAKLSAFFNDFL